MHILVQFYILLVVSSAIYMRMNIGVLRKIKEEGKTIDRFVRAMERHNMNTFMLGYFIFSSAVMAPYLFVYYSLRNIFKVLFKGLFHAAVFVVALVIYPFYKFKKGREQHGRIHPIEPKDDNVLQTTESAEDTTKNQI